MPIRVRRRFDPSVDQSDAPKTVTRTQRGVADSSAQRPEGALIAQSHLGRSGRSRLAKLSFVRRCCGPEQVEHIAPRTSVVATWRFWVRPRSSPRGSGPASCRSTSAPRVCVARPKRAATSCPAARGLPRSMSERMRLTSLLTAKDTRHLRLRQLPEFATDRCRRRGAFKSVRQGGRRGRRGPCRRRRRKWRGSARPAGRLPGAGGTWS